MINEQTSVQSLLEVIRKKSAEKNIDELVVSLKSILEEAGVEVRVTGNTTSRRQLMATVSGGMAGKVIGYSGSIDLADAAEKRAGNESALLAAILAMVRIKKNSDPFQGTLKLLISIGESLEHTGPEQLTRESFVKGLDALVICQPVSGGLARAEKGKLWLELRTTGKGTHGSTPSSGVNAIDHMLAYLDEFEDAIDFSHYEDETLGRSTCSFNVFKGGSAPGTIPDKCVADLDIRTVPGQEHEEILKAMDEIHARLTETIASFDLSIEVLADQPPVITDPEDALVQLATGVVEQIAGSQAVPGVSGSAEMGRFAISGQQVPTIIVGPGIINGVPAGG
ncbi:MAG: M20/M25/M40 family metallo-hydrolase [Bacteroides sp.]|nr:M20/M25/M40 family metallo-hydrolase [Bacteroides sp.]